MTDEELRKLEHRYRTTGSSEDLVAWIRERARGGPILDEAELIGWIRRDPDATRLRIVLAELLGLDPEPCEALLEAETALLAKRDPVAWERYHEARGKAPASWLARLEQPSLVRSRPLPLEGIWISAGLDELRPVEGTYGGTDLSTLPDLPIDHISGFRWLDDHHVETAVRDRERWLARVDALDEAIKGAGFAIPPAFRSLLRDRLPFKGAIDSGTDCYFELDFSPVRALGGLVVRSTTTRRAA